MKNTLENKARFFALYWGQKVCKWEDVNILCVPEEIKQRYNIEDFYLELKPLHQITEEDAVKTYSKFTGYRLNKKRAKEWVLSGIHTKISGAVDFLRSKGYALPYMGISVEQQIQYGWVKLVEPNNK